MLTPRWPRSAPPLWAAAATTVAAATTGHGVEELCCLSKISVYEDQINESKSFGLAWYRLAVRILVLRFFLTGRFGIIIESSSSRSLALAR